jgi:hypothetical protein
MLPQPGRGFPRVRRLLLLAGLLGIAACAERSTPEQQVRVVIESAERAAESRDLSGILENVSSAFEDGQGGGRDELERYLRAYLLTHTTVHLATQVQEIDFPYRDFARVRLTVGSLGRDANGSSPLDISADMKKVVLELQLEDDQWRVVRAEWH